MSKTATPCQHVSTKTWAWLLRVRVRVNTHVMMMLARWRRLFVGKEALLMVRDGSKPGGDGSKTVAPHTNASYEQDDFQFW